jgi:hypothetical protein
MASFDNVLHVIEPGSVVVVEILDPRMSPDEVVPHFANALKHIGMEDKISVVVTPKDTLKLTSTREGKRELEILLEELEKEYTEGKVVTLFPAMRRAIERVKADG